MVSQALDLHGEILEILISGINPATGSLSLDALKTEKLILLLKDLMTNAMNGEEIAREVFKFEKDFKLRIKELVKPHENKNIFNSPFGVSPSGMPDASSAKPRKLSLGWPFSWTRR